MDNSFFLSSLSSHMLLLNLKDCPALPVALCHFTLASLGRTELSLMPPLLAQTPWVLPALKRGWGEWLLSPPTSSGRRVCPLEPLGGHVSVTSHQSEIVHLKVKKRHSPALAHSTGAVKGDIDSSQAGEYCIPYFYPPQGSKRRDSWASAPARCLQGEYQWCCLSPATGA